MYYLYIIKMAKLSEQIKQKKAGKRRGRPTRTERELAQFKIREARKKRAKQIDKRLEKAGSVKQMEEALKNVSPEVRKYLENTPEKARQKVQQRKEKLNKKIEEAKARRKRELEDEERDIEQAEEEGDWEEEQEEEKEYDVEEAYWDEYINRLKRNRGKINEDNLQVTVSDVEDVADEYADYEEEKEEREEEAKIQRERAKRERKRKIEEGLGYEISGKEHYSKGAWEDVLERAGMGKKAQQEFGFSPKEWEEKGIKERQKLRKKALSTDFRK